MLSNRFSIQTPYTFLQTLFCAILRPPQKKRLFPYTQPRNIRYGEAKCCFKKLEFSTFIRTSNGLRAYQPKQQTNTFSFWFNIREQ